MVLQLSQPPDGRYILSLHVIASGFLIWFLNDNYQRPSLPSDGSCQETKENH